MICVVSGYFITGGLHIDGLMDTFDGIYAGRKKMLKAMKDSRVGSFGVQALLIITLIQFASLIKINNYIIYTLPICLFWGRFSTLILIDKFKYLNYKKKSVLHKKYWRGLKRESYISIFLIVAMIFIYICFLKSFSNSILSLILLSTGLLVSTTIPLLLGKKSGGFNGDLCGASVILVETTMLFIHSILL